MRTFCAARNGENNAPSLIISLNPLDMILVYSKIICFILKRNLRFELSFRLNYKNNLSDIVQLLEKSNIFENITIHTYLVYSLLHEIINAGPG
jgi:vesicle coat complex subunit